MLVHNDLIAVTAIKKFLINLIMIILFFFFLLLFFNKQNKKVISNLNTSDASISLN